MSFKSKRLVQHNVLTQTSDSRIRTCLYLVIELVHHCATMRIEQVSTRFADMAMSMSMTSMLVETFDSMAANDSLSAKI
jgi:hypothetical protein